MKTIRGCGEPGMTASVLGRGPQGIKVTTCPRHYILTHGRAFTKVMNAYHEKEKGFLPDEGGLNEQSAQMMKAIGIVGAAVSEAKQIKRSEPKPPKS